jgi:uncharacterized damage-inducible protein DinB
MGARAEALAKKFEAKVDEATAAFEKLSDADWKKVTTEEKWSVGVTAHHIAVAHQIIGGLLKSVADGKASGPATMAMSAIDEMNAKHAKEFADCTKAETIALHKQNAAAAAAMVRGLSDEQLDRSGNLLVGMPAMTAEQVGTTILVGHVDGHLKSIRSTVGA